jgi:DNA-binding response OmpR family regulator
MADTDSTPPAAPAPAPSGKKRILIVEDERPLAHALELKLGKEGYETVVAATGKLGLEQALTGTFDLILLDLILPELDGFSVLTEMKKANIATPVVVLSNLGQDEDRAKAEEFGVKDYLVKSNAPLADILALVKNSVS